MAYLDQTEIRKILKKFRERTNIICSSLFTSDGFVITIEQAPLKEDEDYHDSVCAICSTIVALASQGISTLRDDVSIKNISIIAGDQTESDGFEIILENVFEDVLLGVILMRSLNLGVVLFELNNTIQQLSKYFLRVEQDEKIGMVDASQ